MNENKFWLCFWSIIAIVFSVLVLSISQYHMHKNEVRAQMVKDGANPLAVNCVLDDEFNDDPTCIILAVKEGNE